MKKLIAILVVFALATSFVFAETTVSGATYHILDLISGKTGDWQADKEAGTYNSVPYEPRAAFLTKNHGEIVVAGGNDNFGGSVRYNGGLTAFGWWQPAEFLKIVMGNYTHDGAWGLDGVTRWNFYQRQTDFIDEGAQAWGGSFYGFDINHGAAFYDGFNGGLYIEVTPVEMLAINIGVRNGSGKAEDVYGKLVFQAKLNLDFGTIGLTLNTDGKDDAVYFTEAQPNAKAFLYLGLPLGDAIALDVGVGFPFPKSQTYSQTFMGTTYSYTYTKQDPIGIGLGLKFSGDGFGIKFRAVATLGERLTGKGAETHFQEEPLKLIADVMPFFSIGDNATLFISLGIGIVDAEKGQDNKAITNPTDAQKSKFGFEAHPYIVIGEEWGPQFMAGIRIVSKGDKDQSNIKTGAALDAKGADYISFSIPIGIFVSF